MDNTALPESINGLVNKLQLVSFVWQGVPVQVPKFAVYAMLKKPLFDKYFYHNGRRMGLLTFGRYRIPVLDPFSKDLETSPNHLLIMTHSKQNRFGLYGLPADYLQEPVELPFYHGSVKRLVRDFV